MGSDEDFLRKSGDIKPTDSDDPFKDIREMKKRMLEGPTAEDMAIQRRNQDWIIKYFEEKFNGTNKTS